MTSLDIDLGSLESILQGKQPISRLQELCQQRKFPVPTYKETTGTLSQFANEVTMTIEETTVSFTGMGRTKKLAKTKAVEEALMFLAATKPHVLEPLPGPVSVQLHYVIDCGPCHCMHVHKCLTIKLSYRKASI